MATDEKDGGSESRTNSLVSNSNTSSSQNNDEAAAAANERKGWLMKRSRLSRKWKKRWFLLKNADLFYGSHPENTSKRIPLTSVDISETHIDKKQFAFQIKPKDNGRAFYIHAENELEQNDWMQAICFAKAAGRFGDSSQTCCIQ